MSLVFQNIAGGTAASGKTSTVGKQTAGTGASAGAFNQSLSQMLSGDTTQQDVTANIGAGMLLEGLMKLACVDASGDDAQIAEQNVQDMLQDMLGDADKLDEAIDADPELLTALQGWLGQIQNLLNQVNEENDGASSGNENTLTGPLSENPASIRFVVQDGLAQLASMLKESKGNSQDQTQAIRLLQSFQDILGDALPVQPKPTGEVSQTLHAASKASQPGSEGKGLNGVQVMTGQTMNASDEKELVVSKPDNVNDVFGTQNTITAGQLALREGINASVKPAPVPVEKFSQEMSGFVVNKMEFVKQNGISEARITLYPERLGQVDIKLTMQNGQLVAQFTTEHAVTKDLLEQQMSQLRSSLQTQGVQVEKLVVTQNESLQSQMYQDGRQPGTGQQQSNRRSKGKDAPTDDAVKVAEIGEELNEWLAEQEQPGEGNTFTATA